VSIFLLQASDPDFSAVADFIIIVTDINNNDPVFVFPDETTVLTFSISVSFFTFTSQTQINNYKLFVMITKIRLRKNEKKY
jgi:hypothetical protein